ncbi:MAG: hypothetical protein ACPG31_12470 [Planctomycetota bacterium]
MAVQHDEIDVKHLVQIGLAMTFLSMAVAYWAAGLNYSYDAELEAERQAQAADRVYFEATAAPEGDAFDAARQDVLKKYQR